MLWQLKSSKLTRKELINHKVYCLCGDGDLQEGILYEAVCSLAGLHKLDNLISSMIAMKFSIEGDKLAFNEDVKMRFESQGFEVLSIDGHDYEAIDKALKQAKEANKPCLIIANNHSKRRRRA